MLSVNDLSIQFGTSVLFSKVDLQFTSGNCYGIIGANGAGKSTFVRILSGELEPTSGSVTIDPKCRMSVLKQNQNLYDDCRVIDTVIMGNERLWQCGIEKDAIYEKPDFNDVERGLTQMVLLVLFSDSTCSIYHSVCCKSGPRQPYRGNSDWAGRICSIPSCRCQANFQRRRC